MSAAIAKRLIQLGFLAALLIFWYVGTLPGGINPLLLPSPGPVFKNFGVLVTGTERNTRGHLRCRRRFAAKPDCRARQFLAPECCP